MPYIRVSFPHRGRTVGDVIEVDKDELKRVIREGHGVETTSSAKPRTNRPKKVEPEPGGNNPPSSEE